MYQYLPIPEQLYSPDLGPYHSFGIVAIKVCDGEQQQKAFASDVSTDRDFVEELAERCTAAQLDPIHLKDIVLDSIGK